MNPNRRRQRKQTHAFTLESSQRAYIEQIAERYDFNSFSEALRRILDDHQTRTDGAFLSASDRSIEQSTEEISKAA